MNINSRGAKNIYHRGSRITANKIKAGDVVAVKETKQKSALFANVKSAKVVTPKWLGFDSSKLSGKVVRLPAREDIDLNIEEHLIVELYSR